MCIMPCPQRPKDDVVAPGPGVTGGYEMLVPLPLDAGNYSDAS